MKMRMMRTISTSSDVFGVQRPVGVFTDDVRFLPSYTNSRDRSILGQSQKSHVRCSARRNADHQPHWLDSHFCGCRSLVERCPPVAHQHLADPLRPEARRGLALLHTIGDSWRFKAIWAWRQPFTMTPVSYTHLTLPTTLSG